MTTLKQRHHVYLPDDVSSALDTLGRDPRTSKSKIVEEALRAWFERRAGNALDDRFGIRIGRQHELIVHKLDFLAEALGTFVLHQLTLVAHHPPFTPDAAHLGQQRYRAFVDAVGRKLARAESAPAIEQWRGPATSDQEMED